MTRRAARSLSTAVFLLGACLPRPQRVGPAPPVDVARLEALGRDTSAMNAARTQYQNTCAPCHGARGGGLTGPNLTDNFWIQGGSLASVRHAINLGRPARGMPGWGAVLGDAAVDRLAVYLHTVLRNTRVPEGRGPQGEPE